MVGADARKGGTINSITLDVETPSDTLDVTVVLVDSHDAAFDADLEDDRYYRYTGSVGSAGLQTFTLNTPAVARYGAMTSAADANMEISRLRFHLIVQGSGSGSIELKATRISGTDSDSATGWSLRRDSSSADFHVPKVQLLGYDAKIPQLFYGDVISSPINGDGLRRRRAYRVPVLVPNLSSVSGRTRCSILAGEWRRAPQGGAIREAA